MATIPIRVAIIGGGLGGTVLMNSLMKHPHIDAHIYEAKNTFQERGASVGLAANAQRALKLMGLDGTLQNGRAVPVNGARLFMGHGPERGKLILFKDGDFSTVHRASLLRELLDPIPEDRLHVNTKVVGIKDDNKIITFEDGTSVTTDVIIGADGIHSSIRRLVFDDTDGNDDLVPAGFFDYRALIPLEKALAELGPDIIGSKDRLQHSYVGNSNVIIFNHIEGGDTIALLIAGRTPKDWDRTEWKHSISRDYLIKRFEGWPEFAKKAVDLLFNDHPSIPFFIQWESAPTPRIHKGTTCLMGDAAHAMTSWQAAGLGQAIEDALIIETALGQCRSVEDVPRALEIYDKLMRPRGQRIVESSRAMGNLLMNEQGSSAEQLRDGMDGKWDYIRDWDTEGVVHQVVEAMNGLRTEAIGN